MICLIELMMLYSSKMSSKIFLHPKYDQHDHTHDGEFETCRCETIIREMCPFNEECSSEEYEECLVSYPLYKKPEEVTLSSMPETMLVYVHPSGGTIHHGPMVTGLLKRKHAANPVNYPYGTLDDGMDCYFTVGNYSFKYMSEMCRTMGNITKKRKYKVLFQLIPDVGECEDLEFKQFYTHSLFIIIHRVSLGESVYIQGDNTKVQAILYALVGLLSIDSSLKFDVQGSSRHLRLVYEKHGREYTSLSKYYQQDGLLTNLRLLRTAFHILEVHSQCILPDPIPNFIELPRLIAPSAEALSNVLSRSLIKTILEKKLVELGLRILECLEEESKPQFPVATPLFQRKKFRVSLVYDHIFRPSLISSVIDWNTGLYTPD